METDPKLLEKVDPMLRKALEESSPFQILRIVLVVDRAGGAPARREIEPSDFEHRSDYRAALIRQREADMRGRLGPTLHRLAELGLETRGGRLGRMIVVDGSAQAIAKALELPEVRKAALDQPLELSKAERSGRLAGSS